MAVKGLSYISILGLICFFIHLMYGLSSALIFSSIAAISLLLISLALCVIGIFKFGNEVIAEVEINFYELMLFICSLGVPFLFLVIRNI